MPTGRRPTGRMPTRRIDCFTEWLALLNVFVVIVLQSISLNTFQIHINICNYDEAITQYETTIIDVMNMFISVKQSIRPDGLHLVGIRPVGLRPVGAEKYGFVQMVFFQLAQNLLKDIKYTQIK